MNKLLLNMTMQEALSKIQEITSTLRDLSREDLDIILNFIPIVYSEKSGNFYYKKSDYLLNLDTLEVVNLKTKTKLNDKIMRNRMIRALLEESETWLEREQEILNQILKGLNRIV